MQIGHMETPHTGLARRIVAQVAGVAPHPLVPARAERVGALAGQDDHADPGVLAGVLEGPRDLDDRLRPEGVSHLGPGDRDLCDPLVRSGGALVVDVGEVGVRAVEGGNPVRAHRAKASLCGMLVEPWLTRAARTRPDRVAVQTPAGAWTYSELQASALAGAAGAGRARRRPRDTRRDRASRGPALRSGAARVPARRGGRRSDRPASLTRRAHCRGRRLFATDRGAPRHMRAPPAQPREGTTSARSQW